MNLPLGFWASAMMCGVLSVGLVGCGSTDPGLNDATGGAGSSTAGTSSSGGASSGSGPTAGNAASNAGGSSTNGGAAAGGGNAMAGAATDVGGATSAGGAATVNDDLLPWVEGNSWTYRVDKNGSISSKTTTVGAAEAAGGVGPHAKIVANHVETSKGAGSADRTESWQAPDSSAPERIVRYRELSYDAKTGMLSSEVYCDPPKLHVDGSAAHTKKGASWTEKYSETTLTVGMPVSTHSVSEKWSVIGDDETVTVPAGTFEHVVHFRRVGTTTKDYWYARGVGKVKETGSQTEELSEFSLR